MASILPLVWRIVSLQKCPTLRMLCYLMFLENCIFIAVVLFASHFLLLNYFICCIHTLFSFIYQVMFNHMYQIFQPNSGDKSPKNGSNGSLVKLARRFSQRGERKEPRTLPLNITDDQPHRQRSVSVDR